MQTLPISFTLTNNGETATNAVLFGATCFSENFNKRPLGGTIVDPAHPNQRISYTFKGDDGETEISLSGEPDGQNVKRLHELIAVYGCKIGLAKVSAVSMPSATALFFQKTYQPVAPDKIEVVHTDINVGKGDDANKIIHSFRSPFVAAPNLALIISLAPGVATSFEFIVEISGI